MKLIEIDHCAIGKDDALCPECGCQFGQFKPATRYYGPRLRCGDCGYEGKVSEFVSHETWRRLVRGNPPSE